LGKGIKSAAHWGHDEVKAELEAKLSEPPRIYRRPFGLSYAAMAGWSSMA